MDSCSDSAITLSNGNIGAAMKPAAGGCTWQFISKTKAEIGQWHHVVMTMDGSYMKLYVNGTQVRLNRPSQYGLQLLTQLPQHTPYEISINNVGLDCDEHGMTTQELLLVSQNHRQAKGNVAEFR